MDIYTLGLILGGTGLGAMAVTGLGRHGGGSARGSGQAHGASSGQAGHAGHSSHAGGALRGAVKGSRQAVGGGASRALLALTSPRLIFSVALGFGAVGLALRPFLGGPLLFAAAISAGIIFERLVVSPIWNLSLRFASEPALTLESCVTGEATAVTSFDANGQGIVAIEMDGQMVQILGTLQSSDRQLGIKVHAGERVRIEGVDAARNRCTVSLV